MKHKQGRLLFKPNRLVYTEMEIKFLPLRLAHHETPLPSSIPDKPNINLLLT